MSHETKETSGSGEPSPSDAVPSRYKPLRIWPVVLLLGGMVLLRLLPSLLEDGPPQLWMSAAFGPMLCGVLVVLWWLIGSRATWAERLVGFAGVIAALFATLLLVHESMRGPATPVLTIPMGTAAFATGAVLCSRVLAFKRTVVALLMAVCGFGFSTMLRNDGMWGDFSLGLDWRWHPSAEEQLLADRATRAPAATDALAAPDIDQWLAEPEWPGFRGADRNGRQRGTQISSEWSGAEPEL